MTTVLRQAVREARDARDRAQEAFVRAVMDAREAGAGYGCIAQWLELPRSTVQSMVNRYERRRNG